MGAIAAGDIVIYRVGDGNSALSSASAAVFLDEYTTAGVLVQSIAVPTSISGNNHALTAAGNSTAEGELSLSADGLYLSMAGYDAAVGTAAVATTTAAATNRVIGRVAVDGSIDSSTSLNDVASGGNVRGAASSNGTDFWISASNGGIHYATLGATTSTQIENGTLNTRQVEIVGGNLYFSAATGSASAIT